MRRPCRRAAAGAALFFGGRAHGQLYELDEVALPMEKPYSLQVLHTFYVYSRADSPQPGGVEPYVRFWGVGTLPGARREGDRCSEEKTYQGVQLSFLNRNHFWDLVEKRTFCDASKRTLQFKRPLFGKRLYGGPSWRGFSHDVPVDVIAANFPTLRHPSANNGTFGNVSYSAAQGGEIAEGSQIWSDQNYVFSKVRDSGIPAGAQCFMWPYMVYPGHNETVTLTTPTAGTVYFWSDSQGARHGNFPITFARDRLGSMEYEKGVLRTYRRDVAAGETVNFPLATSEFVGGFAWKLRDAPTLSYSASGVNTSVTFLDADGQGLEEGAQVWSDRNLAFRRVNASGIPAGVKFWMRPFGAFAGHSTGHSREVVIKTPVAGTVYFWAEARGRVARNANFHRVFRKFRLGSMGYTNGTLETYKQDVPAGGSVRFSIITPEFVGGFGWKANPAPSMEFNTTGAYYLVLSNCGGCRDVTITGTVELRNTYGLLPGNEYHKLSFYRFLTACFGMVAMAWIVQLTWWRRQLHAVHHIMTAAAACGLSEAFLWWLLMSYQNSTGVSSPWILCAAILTSVLKSLLSYILVATAFTGWGVTHASLEVEFHWHFFAVLFLPAQYTLEGVLAHQATRTISGAFKLCCWLPSVALQFAALTIFFHSLLDLEDRVVFFDYDGPQATASRRLGMMMQPMLVVSLIVAAATGIDTSHLLPPFSWHAQWFLAEGLPDLYFCAVISWTMFVLAPSRNMKQHFYAVGESMENELDGDVIGAPVASPAISDDGFEEGGSDRA